MKLKLMESIAWNRFDKFEGITDKYMPRMGEGETMASQIVTAVNKLIYKWYNDGDVFDNGYGLRGWANDLSSYANWLYKNILETRPILKRIEQDTEMSYSETLFLLAEKVLNPEFLAKYENKEARGSIYSCEGPFEFVYYDEDEDDDLYENIKKNHKSKLLTEAARGYSYDAAVDYIEAHGVSCDPAGHIEGEYVCDILDADYDYMKYQEPYYYKRTLDDIIKRAEAYIKEKEEEDDEIEIRSGNQKVKLRFDYDDDSLISINSDFTGDLVLPDRVEDISNKFWSKFKGSSITFSSNITLGSIYSGLDRIWDAKNLEAIHVVDDNPDFTSVDGILYTKDKKTLVACPFKKDVREFTIPQGVEKIRHRAFRCNESLKTVNFPASLKEIEAGAFSLCAHLSNVNFANGSTDIKIEDYAFTRTNINHIKFPDKISIIEDYAFYYCPLKIIELPTSVRFEISEYAFDLRSVDKLIYYGSEEQFKAINDTISTSPTTFYDCVQRYRKQSGKPQLIFKPLSESLKSKHRKNLNLLKRT